MNDSGDKPEEPEAGAPPTDKTHLGNTVRASWNISLHHLRANTHHMRPESREAMVALFRWCTDPRHPVTLAECAARSGIAENTLYKLLTGRYLDPKSGERRDLSAAQLKAVRDFLAIEQERFLGGENEFVMTPTARKIGKAVELARESQTVVFMISRSHLGKTTALVYHTAVENHGRTIYVRMKAASGLGGMVRRIADCVGISPNGNTADLVDRIKRALTPNMVLILDEVHELEHTYRKQSFFSCLEVIREIHDEAGCGIVLSATDLLMDAANTATRGELEQLMRRGVHRFYLGTRSGMPLMGDIEAILEHNGLELPGRKESVTVAGTTEKPREVIVQLAKRDGLKAITERLRYGRKIAARTEETLAWEHVIEAHLRIAANAIQDDDWS